MLQRGKRLFHALDHSRFSSRALLSVPVPIPVTVSGMSRLRHFSSDGSVQGESRWVLKSDLEIEAINAPDAHNNWVPKAMTPEEISEMNARLGVVVEGEEIGGQDELNERRKAAKGIKYKEDYLKTDENSMDHKIKGFLDWNPAMCSGCGTPFQSKSLDSPGYLSKDKFAEHRLKSELIRKQQDAVQLLDVAGIATNSPLAVEILQQAGTPPEVIEGVVQLGGAQFITPAAVEKVEVDTSARPVIETDAISSSSINPLDRDAVNDQVVKPEVDKSVIFGYDPDTLEPIYNIEDLRKSYAREKPQTYEKKNRSPESVRHSVSDKSISICQRCFRLQEYGDVENHLRPGWSDHELLTPERFAELLAQIKNSKAVVLCLIDLFDIEGSLLSNLNEIAGRNPIIIAANKVDLLPNDASLNRVTDWVYSSVKDHCGLLSPKQAEIEDQKEYLEKGWYRSRIVGSGSNKDAVVGILRRPDVHLISCETGRGVDEALKKVIGLAASHGEKIYVMGTANVGKSSFINRLLEFSDKSKSKSRSKGKKSKRNNITPQATVSNLPGTTLDFLKIRLPNGIVVYDTPGLINEGQLTSRLTPHELRQVIPKRQIQSITLRMERERVVMLGGLARIEHVEGRPFLCTFFVSNKVNLHPTRAEKVDNLLRNHTGEMLFPPQNYNRVLELGPTEDFFFEIEGHSWGKASKDIVIAGLGWMSITGPGPESFTVKVTAPHGTTVRMRDPIMPFEARETTATHTGGRFVKKSSKRNFNVGSDSKRRPRSNNRV